MKTLTTIALLCFAWGSAQHTLQLKRDTQSPQATIEEVAWLAGHWRGYALGGVAEEMWSPPAKGSMMFAFRMLHKGEVSFYELGHIKEVDSTLQLQLKHFDGALKGWESQEETVDFKLVQIAPNAIYFEGLTMVKIAKDQLRCYVLVEEQGTTQELVFDFSAVLQ
ncbi:MAG: DUF6265 family protein [Bacteroidota bacterium]